MRSFFPVILCSGLAFRGAPGGLLNNKKPASPWLQMEQSTSPLLTQWALVVAEGGRDV